MEVVRLLVEKFRVNVNQVDSWKRTVLHYLAEGKYWWHTALAIPYLLSKGADPSMENQHGQTSLQVALHGHYFGHTFSKEALHAIIEGNTMQKKAKGETPLSTFSMMRS